MPLWPFGRKKRRDSSGHVTQPEKLSEKEVYNPNFPQNATPRSNAARTTADETPRKRRRSFERADIEADRKENVEDYEKVRTPRSRTSREDITALPGTKRLERSPHLRKASVHSPAIPYNASPVPSSRKGTIRGTDSPRGKQPSRNPSSPSTQKRRLSRRQEHVEKALREEEIRAMSAPVAIPKRSNGHGDMQKRDSKKARRFSKAGGDSRGSNVSLPFQESIHSSMSGVSDKRGWEVGGLDFLNPRPTVRLSGPGMQSASYSGAIGVSRNGSKKEKLPALKEDAKRKERRRVAELADDLDSSDLRVLMERDTRRREKKRTSDKEKLERSLRKRADKQKLEDERRAREMGTTSPTAVHPAFRTGKQKEMLRSQSNLGQAPPTPTSIQDEEGRFHTPLQRGKQKERNPFEDPIQSPFADPEPKSPASLVERHPQTQTPLEIPSEPAVETPMEDPVLETARAVRLSQNRMSGLSPSPPHSPVRRPEGERLSPLRREYTPDIPEQQQAPVSAAVSKDDSNAPKRTGTWAQFFRRAAPTRTTEEHRASMPESSFSNTSRDSMSRQPIPAHLVGAVPKRRSNTPVRTQSIFREDLPESSGTPPDSRINSTDAGFLANMRKSRQGGSFSSHPHMRGATPDLAGPGRTDSPVDTEGRNSAMALSGSLASIDSEGSWLTGRPSKRKSNQSQLRSETGSLSKRREDFNASYEDLGMAEDEFFRRLTPNPETAGDARGGASEVEEDGTLVRRATSRRRPTLVQRDPRVKSREGLVTDYLEADTATAEEDPLESTAQSEVESLGDNDKFEHQAIEYGKGHARQMSSGSAKLLDIPPSRTRSGRTSPDNRQSTVSTSEPATPRL